MDERKSEAVTSHDAAARGLAGSHLIVDEDCWYSCPASGQCCRDDVGTECDCGYEQRVVGIAAALREAEARGLEEAANHKEECHFSGRFDDTIDWCRAQAQARRAGPLEPPT